MLMLAELLNNASPDSVILGAQLFTEPELLFWLFMQVLYSSNFFFIHPIKNQIASGGHIFLPYQD